MAKTFKSINPRFSTFISNININLVLPIMHFYVLWVIAVNAQFRKQLL